MAAIGNYQRVLLQFSFSNSKVIPSNVSLLDKETLEERVARKSRSTGFMIIQPTERCSLAEFVDNLKEAGFQLIDAFCKERINPGKPSYYAVRFTFSQVVEEPSKEIGGAIDGLKTITQEALWRIRAFDNPLYKDGQEVDGQRAISINLEVRQPLCLSDGQPITVWQKDSVGNRVGTVPIPIKAGHKLTIIDKEVCLISIS